MAAKTLDRTYNIPLRKEFMKVPRWKKTPKAVIAAKQFLSKHMKSEDIRLGKDVNELMWKHGGKNPPHHIKVFAVKDKEGIVRASLTPIKAEKKSDKKAKKEAKVEAKAEEAKEAKVEAKTKAAPEAKTEEAKEAEAPKAEEKSSEKVKEAASEESSKTDKQ